MECAPLCTVEWLKNGVLIDPQKTDRYHIVNRTIEPQVNRNDFEATESTLVSGVLARTTASSVIQGDVFGPFFLNFSKHNFSYIFSVAISVFSFFLHILLTTLIIYKLYVVVTL